MPRNFLHISIPNHWVTIPHEHLSLSSRFLRSLSNYLSVPLKKYEKIHPNQFQQNLSIGSMYGIVSYLGFYHTNQPNVRKYRIHGFQYSVEFPPLNRRIFALQMASESPMKVGARLYPMSLIDPVSNFANEL